MADTPYVLLTWLATRYDDPRQRRPGEVSPTLRLLVDEDSPYRGRVARAVVFYTTFREEKPGTFARLADELCHQIRSRGIDARSEACSCDPDDHRALFTYLREATARLRSEVGPSPFLVNTTAGRKAMHATWVLLHETGALPPPATLVQVLQKGAQGARGFVLPVDVGVETPLREYVTWGGSPGGPLPPFDPSQLRAPAHVALYAEARRLARLRVPVLLLGERGVGKSTLASYLRASSPYRKATDMPSVACGQFTGELLRSELFGHVKGAFTGASAARAGLVAQADEDTLFLDEVGDLGRDVQRLLIRALEDGRFTPVGSTEERASRFRLVTATNLPESELRRRLDPDFFDRIGYFVLTVPPLRSVREDVPQLWERVLSEAGRRSDVGDEAVHRVRAVADAVVGQLIASELRGNYRDLYRVAFHLLADAASEGRGFTRRAAETRVRSVLSERRGVPEVATSASGEGGGETPEGHLLRRLVVGDLPRREELPEGRLPTARLLGELRRRMAVVARALADRDGVPEDTVVDVSARSLQSWRKA